MIETKKVVEYSKNLKVLYVEDDEVLLNETKELLENFFYEVIVAKDGKEGWEKYNTQKFDIVFSDIKMPKIDGIELSKMIVNKNPDQAVVIISAYNDADKLLSLIQIGISDFLLKPMNLEHLLKVLYKVSKNVYNSNKQQQFLMAQSRLAMMGEMVDMTAHQWLQYLNVLTLKSELLKMSNKNNSITSKQIDEFVDSINREIDGLVDVLEEFRSFFRNKPKIVVLLKDIINSILILFQDYLLKHNIETIITIQNEKVEVYPNELKQVLLNVIINMVENFNDRDIKNRKIYFISDIDDNHIILKIVDNGGGIETNIIDNIFEPKFTTKKYGSGIGLYLSKIIMTKIDGKIMVKNRDDGVEFQLLFKN